MTTAVELAAAGEIGFRFHPTDQELVGHFLKLKMLGCEEKVKRIPEIDICEFEPRELPEYFFCRPVPKYPNCPNSTVLNRATKKGSWKVTGGDHDILARSGKEVIGNRKTLVFYENNKPKPTRTNWIIYEYHSKATHDPSQEFMLCRLKCKHDDTTDTSSSNRNFEAEAEDTIRGEADVSRPVTRVYSRGPRRRTVDPRAGEETRAVLEMREGVAAVDRNGGFVELESEEENI